MKQQQRQEHKDSVNPTIRYIMEHRNTRIVILVFVVFVLMSIVAMIWMIVDVSQASQFDYSKLPRILN